MIIEFLVATALVYGVNSMSKTNKDKRTVKRDFKSIMAESGIATKSGETYYISKVYPKPYGYLCTIHIPKSKSMEKLEQIKEELETNLECLIELERKRYNNYATMKVIKTPQNEGRYKVEKQEPWEAVLGYDRTGKIVKINMNKTAHLLIGGVVGTGKSRLAYILLTNLAANCNEKIIQLYFSQIRKMDFHKFKNLHQTQWYAKTLQDTLNMLINIEKAIDRRNELLEELECENIYEYNKKNRQKMKYKWIFMEEFSFYMPKDGDTEEERDLKQKIITNLTKIIMSGRNVACWVICVTQRSTATNIDPNIKSQMNRCTGRQKSGLDSHNIIDIPDAVSLEDQEFILNSDAYYWFKAPYIDRAMINEALKECTKPIDVITEESAEETGTQTEKKVVDATFEVVNDKPKGEPLKLTGIMTMEDFENASKNR